MLSVKSGLFNVKVDVVKVIIQYINVMVNVIIQYINVMVKVMVISLM